MISITFKPRHLAFVALFAASFLANGDLDTVRRTGNPVATAEAVIGRPLTPVSYAGVARRTTARMIRRTTIYVATLPPSCVATTVSGTALWVCGTTYYQQSGAQYVVVQVE